MVACPGPEAGKAQVSNYCSPSSSPILLINIQLQRRGGLLSFMCPTCFVYYWGERCLIVYIAFRYIELRKKTTQCHTRPDCDSFGDSQVIIIRTPIRHLWWRRCTLLHRRWVTRTDGYCRHRSNSILFLPIISVTSHSVLLPRRPVVSSHTDPWFTFLPYFLRGSTDTVAL